MTHLVRANCGHHVRFVSGRRNYRKMDKCPDRLEKTEPDPATLRRFELPELKVKGEQ